MLASMIARHLKNPAIIIQSCRSLNPAQVQHNYQQTRGRKIPRVYDEAQVGIEPLITEEEFQNTVDNNLIEDLRYKEIRFALVDKTTSVFYDKDLHTFEQEVMRHGRKTLAKKIMRDTFYEIKCIMLEKNRKMLKASEKAAAKAASKKQETTPSTNNALTEEGAKAQIESLETNPLVIFKQALLNVRPVINVKPIKRGGATYQVPFPISSKDGAWIALKWMNATIKNRPKPRVRSYREYGAREFIDAFNNEGKVIKQKDDLHKLAEANKTYAHYRWA